MMNDDDDDDDDDDMNLLTSVRLCTDNTAQNIFDNLPSYIQQTIIAVYVWWKEKCIRKRKVV